MNIAFDNRLTDYGSPLFAAWRSACGDAWQDYVDHKFVRGLGNGELPKPVFIAYLVQDYLYLTHYARAWSMVVVKADEVEQMCTAAGMVNALINQELKLHVGICAEKGFSEADLRNAEEASETLAYTRYVMDRALSGDLVDLLAALAPCVLGYGEIGLRLARQRDTLPEYRQWIDTYRAAEYQQLCQVAAGLIEGAAATRLGPNPTSHPRWPSLCRTFARATRLEVDFWSMGYRLAASA